ncbi:cytochrome P450 [Schizopora paradoxa]|uniref:Cytochrome P450 n=1 Tax=Schizopora paradoxa TaxID=27342 RepID=A0A0H2S829_9AGAM|nr:cytochrome P450 [Schizopora paradoxa]
MAVTLVQGALIALVSLSLWHLVRPFFIKSPLANIPGPQRTSLWKGNFHQIFNRRGWNFHRELAKKYGNVVKVHGLFGREELFVMDPLALHHIVVKDQYVYEETDSFILGNGLIFGIGLLSTRGDHHKKQRKMLNPVFSLAHMRRLIPIFNPIVIQLQDVLSEQVRLAGGKDVDIMKWLSRAALELIGQAGLGYTFHALDDTKTDSYSETLKRYQPANHNVFLFRQFLTYLLKIGTPKFRRAVVEAIPWKPVQELIIVSDKLQSISKQIYDTKVAAMEKGDEEHQIGRGKDIMSVLLKANRDASEEDRLPEEEIFGQMNGFIQAAHETTTSSIARVLTLLSQHQDIQDKLREAVTSARKEAGGEFDYESLMTIPYLDAVCRETLRVYPPVTHLVRIARKDISLPLMWPITSADGKSAISEVPVKKNTNVIMSILGANLHKEIWGPDAEEWKPERWLEPLPESVGKAHMPGVYASMMTFLGGGRACIGFKFAEMELKLVLATLLHTFKFQPGSKEIYWNMGGVANPVVKDSPTNYPELPLKVTMLL